MLTQDEKLMERAIELAIISGKKGHNTFGAVLVHDGKIIEEGESTASNQIGAFGHAEFNLVHNSVGKYGDDFMSECVVYTSTSPCVRCLMAIASLGVKKIFYSVSYEKFSLILPHKTKLIDYPTVLKTMGVEMEMIGPVLEDEGMKVYSYRYGKYQAMEEILEESAILREKEA